MAAKKGKEPQVPARVPADKLLLDFIKDNKLTLVVDEVTRLQADVKDVIYINIKRPRVRAFYLDDINKIDQQNGQPNNAKVDIVS